MSYPVGANPQAVVTADFNGDGRLDLAVANYGEQHRERAAGQRRRHVPAGPELRHRHGPRSLAVGDFNADGKLDLATANAVTT